MAPNRDPGHHDRMIELGARSPGRPALPSPAGRLANVRAGHADRAGSRPRRAGRAAARHRHRRRAATGRRAAAAPNLEDWTGGVNLYRDGVFTTQSSWLYCTAADVQMVKNMIEGTEDHSGSAQTAYFDWMRTQNQYDLPLSAGVDPAGWTAGMRHFVNDRYRLVSTTSFGLSLQLAVVRMRLTGLPVALAVAHGNHGWILNGFTATADPAVTSDFAITGVSVTGPLWGLQSKNGYDMPPNTTLSVDQLKTYFTRWHYDPLPMVWDGTFVSIQPLTDDELAAAAATPPPPTPAPTPAPTPVATITPGPAGPTTIEPTARPTPEVAAGGSPGAVPNVSDPGRRGMPRGRLVVVAGRGALVLVAGAIVAVRVVTGRTRR